MLDRAIEALGSAASVSPASGGTALLTGTDGGRDADRLAALGYVVVALDDAAGRSHAGVHRIRDRLPCLPELQRLGIAYDLILLGAAWGDVRQQERGRAFRTLVMLLKPGGRLVAIVASAEDGREMEDLARDHGARVLGCAATRDQNARAMVLTIPHDGAGALPLLRGIILDDDKASTYKLAMLRAVARIADSASGAAVPHGTEDAVSLPMGLVALNWVRQYLPLVAGGLPQLPGNIGAERLSFAKRGFGALQALGVAAQDLRVGHSFDGERAYALAGALSDARRTIADMPARFTRFPDGGAPVFAAAPASPPRLRGTLMLDLPALRAHGTLSVPGPVWRTLQRFGAWVEPVLVAEWARLISRYASGMDRTVLPGQAEQALLWLDPARDTALARAAVIRLSGQGTPVRCTWTGARLTPGLGGPDIDHCLPWSASPCGDLWNLLPASRRVNRVDKADRLPSAAALQGARSRVIAWWQEAWLTSSALAWRFDSEAAAALPVTPGADLEAVFAGLQWRRLRVRQDQQVREWPGAPPKYR